MNELSAFLALAGGVIQTIATPIIVYLVWDIKRNHLPHIYDRLGTLGDDVAFLRGVDTAESRRRKI